jgi:hypothetical protein
MRRRRAKNPHAVALGRLAGQKSAAGRMKKLTPEERQAIARKAVETRWARYRAAQERKKSR